MSIDRYRYRDKDRYILLVLLLWRTLTKIVGEAEYLWGGWEDLEKIKRAHTSL